ncbi:MAG: family 16 glycosylhydrolase [Jatrophihabitans sp.]
MSITPSLPPARRKRSARALTALAVAVTTVASVVALPTAAGAATCSPLFALLNMCTMPAPAPAPAPAYFSMDDGLPANLGLDPAYAPALSIPAEPSTSAPSTPTDPTQPCGGDEPTKPDGTAWTCTFSDEFSGTTLNTAKWSPQLTSQTSFTSGSGLATTCYVNSPNNIAVAGGALALTVRQEAGPFLCGPAGSQFASYFTAGGVSSQNKFSQAYGRFTIRAAFPSSVLQGLQSSLWLWPNNAFKYGPWPQSGEIDIAEYYTSRPNFVVPTVHYYPTAEQDTSKGINTTTDAFCHFDDAGRFHDYTLTWTTNLLAIYYDKTLCMFDHWKPYGLTAPAPFDSPFFVTLTSAIGNGADSWLPGVTQLPATTKIDYVRVWK